MHSFSSLGFYVTGVQFLGGRFDMCCRPDTGVYTLTDIIFRLCLGLSFTISGHVASARPKQTFTARLLLFSSNYSGMRLYVEIVCRMLSDNYRRHVYHFLSAVFISHLKLVKVEVRLYPIFCKVVWTCEGLDNNLCSPHAAFCCRVLLLHSFYLKVSAQMPNSDISAML